VNVAQRSNCLAWAIIGGLLLVDLVWMSQTAISIVPLSLIGPLAIGAGTAALAVYYRVWRQEQRLADALDLVGQMVGFMVLGALFSYLVVTPGMPMRDAALESVDRALGLDWLGYLRWLDGHAWFARILSFAYASFMPQILLLLIVLPFMGQGQAARVTVLAMLVAGVVTITISGLFPALSTFAHYRVDLTDYPHLDPAADFIHLPDLLAAHSGQPLHLDLTKAYGIITFPSYHAALGLLALLGAWSNRWLRWPFFVVNALMIIATPIDGGHYFSDVLGGLTIAAGSHVLARRALLSEAAALAVARAESPAALPATS
jgi:membrane-associated phospholipid phosphatase